MRHHLIGKMSKQKRVERNRGPFVFQASLQRFIVYTGTPNQRILLVAFSNLSSYVLGHGPQIYSFTLFLFASQTVFCAPSVYSVILASEAIFKNYLLILIFVALVFIAAQVFF